MLKIAVRGIGAGMAFLYLFTVVSCSKPATPSRSEQPVSHERTITLSNMDAQIVDLVNQIRHTKNLPPLKVLQAASVEALSHSQDMAYKRVPFGHDGFRQRAIVLANDLNGSSATGENV